MRGSAVFHNPDERSFGVLVKSLKQLVLQYSSTEDWLENIGLQYHMKDTGEIPYCWCKK